MWIRYKDHQRDNVPAHVREFGGVARVIFLDVNGGVADVRDRAHIELLLRDPGKRYELAYEHLGVAFDVSGRQIAPAETVNGQPAAPQPSEARPVAPTVPIPPPNPVRRPLGRLKKASRAR